MAGSTECLKYALIVLNILLSIFGIILIGVGIWLLVEFPAFNRILDNSFIRASVYIIIVIGIVLILLALFSLFAAIQLSTIALGVFVAIQLAIFILEWVAVGFVFYVGSADVHDYLANEANKTLVQYDEVASITISWDDMHQKGTCCGINGPQDFQYVALFDTLPEDYPDSCCVEDSSGTIVDRPQCHAGVSNFYFENGCLSLFEKFVDENIYVGGGLAITVALIQLACVCVAIALICFINDIVVHPDEPPKSHRHSQHRMEQQQQTQDPYEQEMEQSHAQTQTISQWQEQY